MSRQNSSEAKSQEQLNVQLKTVRNGSEASARMLRAAFELISYASHRDGAVLSTCDSVLCQSVSAIHSATLFM